MNLENWPILSHLKPYFLKTVRSALVFGKCGSEALLLTRDNCVYAIGKNLSGCLGLGGMTPCSTLTQVPALSWKNIEDFAYGGNFICQNTPDLFVVARCTDGGVYQWGHIPNTGPENCLLEPYRVTNLEYKVVEVTCGIAHCMARCENGQIYSWGDNSKKQLGRVLECEVSDVDGNLMADRVQELDGQFVVQIACGAYFSVAVIEGGKVMSWGCNDKNQIGVKDSDTLKLYLPTKVDIPEDVVIRKVACGYASVVALTKTGGVYIWGTCYNSGVSGNLIATTTSKPLQIKAISKSPNIESNYLFNCSIIQRENLEVICTGDITKEVAVKKFSSVEQALLECLSIMSKPLRLEKRRRNIAEIMENAFEYPVHSDVTIVVECKKICVHKSMLSIRSNYFRTMLAGWVDTDENVITITDKKYEVIEAYLRYIYTDKLKVDLRLAVDLLMLADEYGDYDFKLLCEKNIQDNMSMDMVFEVYAITKTISDTEDLSAFCIDFAMRHPNVMMNTIKFGDWDAATTKTFFAEYVKRKEHDSLLPACKKQRQC